MSQNLITFMYNNGQLQSSRLGHSLAKTKAESLLTIVEQQTPHHQHKLLYSNNSVKIPLKIFFGAFYFYNTSVYAKNNTIAAL